MKKILTAILCAGLALLFAAGCMGGTNTANDKETGDEASSLKASDYKNDLEGLSNYFAAYGYVNPQKPSTYVDMDASLIGAKKGRKYTSTTIKNTTIELYEYDTAKLNAQGKEIIASVKKDGTFTILDLPSTKAYLSDNGKFLMVYSDKSIDDANPKKDDENYKTRATVIDQFKEFHADGK